MSDFELVEAAIDLDREIDNLATRYRAAGNFGVQVLNVLNWPAEGLLERLPENARSKLETATVRGLEAAMSAASGSRSLVKDQKPWVNTATTTAVGIVGGMGGLATALAELPVTVTMLMRSVQAVAAEHGFNPDDEQTRKDALLVFAAAGPLKDAGGKPDLNFLSSRVTLTGVNVYIGIGLIAPRLAMVLGRKLAAQTIPVIGAATAAVTNYSYSGYYHEMGQVVFGLRALEEKTGTPFAELVELLSARLDG
ncbi:EcsC family protein [Tropicibacter oceani]|uniref:EcsC family protein n=1 Tax=Tropicibacter oceani TaxID=3058420 RepID=A0ABY8QG20_9RHOB|nr:EcsC family protein [Tropicibacter oceani]WGW03475.1 EcsC family protein [Tropicibacter oceani]